MRSVLLVMLAAGIVALSAAPSGASRITTEPAGTRTVRGTVTVETLLGFVRVTCHKEEAVTLNEGTIEGSLTLNGNNAGTLTNIRLSECTGGQMETSLNREITLSYVRITEREWILTALGFRVLFEASGLRCLLTILMVIRSVGTRNEFELWELTIGSILSVQPLTGSCPNEWIMRGSLPLGGRLVVRLTA
jgi:hypothetical protein